MKPVDEQPSTCIGFNTDNDNEDSYFKVCDHVRISKCKNSFEKGYLPNWLEGVFAVKNVKRTVSWTYVISVLSNEEIVGISYEEDFQKTNQKEFRVEKVVQKKGDELYVKCKAYDKNFNSLIDKKVIA